MAKKSQKNVKQQSLIILNNLNERKITKMKQQKYIIENQESFELKDIFECGQCFRWNKNEDGTYTGVINKGVLNVEKQGKNVIFTGVLDGDIEEIVRFYFDLDRNYEEIKAQLSNIDKYLKTSVEYGKGIRILNQDLWETIISFIISANNNIPRIKGIIERISEKYGAEIEWNGKNYYTFPTPEQLSQATVEDLRALGTGFRDVRIYETTQKVLMGEIDLNEIAKKDTLTAREELLTLSGVGPKVADCILLFSTLKRFDVFPIDVWVRRVMNELYIKNEDENKVSKKEIMKIAEQKFGAIQGLAQQYLFYWKREA